MGEAMVAGLTATTALGVALSVQAGEMTMDEAQRRAPDMLDHLRRMGFEIRRRGYWTVNGSADLSRELDNQLSDVLPGAAAGKEIVVADGIALRWHEVPTTDELSAMSEAEFEAFLETTGMSARVKAALGRGEHAPGDEHHFWITCQICGQPGQVRLSLEPFEGLGAPPVHVRRSDLA